MSGFSDKILKAISDYKLILRRNLPARECVVRIRKFGIKRKSVLAADEVGLYKIGLKIIEDIKQNWDVENNKSGSNSYHGLKEFLQYLEDLFFKYSVKSGRVVHAGQKTSGILVDALQLISLAKGELTNDMLRRIKRYEDIISVYGNEEQQKIFSEAVGEGVKS